MNNEPCEEKSSTEKEKRLNARDIMTCHEGLMRTILQMLFHGPAHILCVALSDFADTSVIEGIPQLWVPKRVPEHIDTESIRRDSLVKESWLCTHRANLAKEELVFFTFSDTSVRGPIAGRCCFPKRR